MVGDINVYCFEGNDAQVKIAQVLIDLLLYWLAMNVIIGNQ